MKILWFCNVMLPQIAECLNKNSICTGSWLVGLSEGLLKSPDIELTVAFPISDAKSIISGSIDNLAYYGFPNENRNICKYINEIEVLTATIIKTTNPDVIHIFGTEFPHTLAIVNACVKLKMINRALLNIQGLVSICSIHYYSGLPNEIVSNYTLRDFIKQDNIRQQAKSFKNRGTYEIEVIKKVRHISGRTDWDRACTSQINPEAQYHFCNETLRDEFYKHSWDINKCECHSIFMSQAYYPIKGLHFVLEALPEIIGRFPDTHLYIASYNITRDGEPFVKRLLITSYGAYIKKLIKKYKLEKHITFTGVLDEKAMCERFLKSHVFVSASSIENSPNSLCEAMLLGVPSVSSDVGGVKNLMLHNEEGFLYQYDAPYMLAYYVCNIFSNEELAIKISEKAREHAKITHEKEINKQRMLDIYKEICI